MPDDSQNKNFGLILLILGLFILLSRFVNLGELLWPFYIIIPGILLFVGAIVGENEFLALSIPASIITAIGLILFAQNITGHFESWAYAWALIPVSIGIGMVHMGSRTFNNKLQEKGYRLIRRFLGFFLAFGLFFELFIFKNWLKPGPGSLATPIVLIIAGLYFFKRSRGHYVVFEEHIEDEDDDFDYD